MTDGAGATTSSLEAPRGLARWLAANRFLLCFAALASLMGTSVGVAKIATALYAVELGASPALFGMLVAGQMVGTLAMSIPVGMLVDRWGPRRLFVLGSSLAGATYALIPAGGSAAFLLGCTIAISFFMPLRFVSLNTVFFEQIRRMGSTKAAWYRATHMSGQFLIGPAVAVGLIGLLGFAGTWWALAATFALTIAISPIVLPRGRVAHTAAGASPAARGLAATLALPFRDRELGWIVLVDFLAQGIMVYQTMFVVVIALDTFGMDAGGASAFVTGAGGAFIAALFLSGGTIARFGPRAAYIIGFGAVIAGLVPQGLAGSAAWFWPGLLLCGAGLGWLQTCTLARMPIIGHRHGQGRVSGIVMLTPPLAGVAAGLIGSWAGHTSGLQSAFLLFTPPCVAMMAIAARRLRSSEEPVR